MKVSRDDWASKQVCYKGSYVKKDWKSFKNVKLLVSKDWPLPRSMYSKKKLLEKLKKKGLISYKTKYGLILYSSEIYIAY